MSMELAIAIAGIIGLFVGLAIGRQGRKERDARIGKLEQELTTIRNVAEAQNDTINRLRKKLEKRNGKKEEENG